MTLPPSHLPSSPGAGELKAKRMPTVRQQYDLARFATHDKEDHWLAVEKYFPPDKGAENKHYARLARRGRANWYVAERRLPDALKLYADLANVEDAEVDLQLSGLAGEAVVYHRFLQNEQDRQTEEWLDQQTIERLIRLRDEPNLDP